MEREFERFARNLTERALREAKLLDERDLHEAGCTSKGPYSPFLSCCRGWGFQKKQEDNP